MAHRAALRNLRTQDRRAAKTKGKGATRQLLQTQTSTKPHSQRDLAAQPGLAADAHPDERRVRLVRELEVVVRDGGAAGVHDVPAEEEQVEPVRRLRERFVADRTRRLRCRRTGTSSAPAAAAAQKRDACEETGRTAEEESARLVPVELADEVGAVAVEDRLAALEEGHLEVEVVQDLDERALEAGDLEPVLDAPYEPDGVDLRPDVLQQPADERCVHVRVRVSKVCEEEREEEGKMY